MDFRELVADKKTGKMVTPTPASTRTPSNTPDRTKTAKSKEFERGVITAFEVLGDMVSGGAVTRMKQRDRGLAEREKLQDHFRHSNVFDFYDNPTLALAKRYEGALSRGESPEHSRLQGMAYGRKYGLTPESNKMLWNLLEQGYLFDKKRR